MEDRVIKLITKEQIIDTNKRIMDLRLDPGDIFFIRDDATLDFVVYRFQQSHTLEEKAAVILYHIARNQIFGNGNKRTSIESAKLFLDLNEYRIKATDEELENAVLSIANNEIGYHKVFAWLKDKVIQK